MKRARASTGAKRPQAVTPRRIWRVFEYRRPPVPVRPRFTT
jgi:hypothetical protein